MAYPKTSTLPKLNFTNRFTTQLPADPRESNGVRQVEHAAYSRVLPASVPDPKVVAVASEVAEFLELDAEFVSSPAFAHIFSGNLQLGGMDPFAMAYGGHQFGNWAGQLGDGRAINLGEIQVSNGDYWALQLKGSGLTPFSRGADGKAVLRSSIREFLCSEAMHHLGVPTTRALSLVTTGESVIRDILYSGNPQPEPGAIVCRVAPSFTRFGNFQLPYSRQDHKLLKELVDYTIRNDFPHLGEPSKDTYIALYREVALRTAEMIVHWMRVGFVHGVMNTDNMSVLGLTIDYGPYGWLDNYDPNWTPNTTDSRNRRYRYGHQPQVAQWNLAQLGNALVPLIEDDIPALQDVVDAYGNAFGKGYSDMLASKIGLKAFEEGDDKLLTELQQILQVTETDMTIFFRKLADWSVEAVTADTSNTDLIAPLFEAYYKPAEVTGEVEVAIAGWLKDYAQRIKDDGTSDADRKAAMNNVNPKYVLRNYMAQLAIDDAEEGDNGLVNELLELLRNPYDEQPDMEKWFAKRPDWARSRPGCSMLSCSS